MEWIAGAIDTNLGVALILVGVTVALVALMAFFDRLAAWLNGPSDEDS